MTAITRPMLAGKVEVDSMGNLVFPDARLPVIASPKLDGVRCVTILDKDGFVKAVSRNWKPIANNFTRTWIEEHCPAGLDGELMVRDANGKNAEFSQVTSGIMSEDGEPDFFYAVFDFVLKDLSTPFVERIRDLKEMIALKGLSHDTHIKIVPQATINNLVELKKFLDICLAEGFEGVMIRDPQGRYKCGRSSLKEGLLLKIKLFDPDEAKIEGFEEQMHNSNEAGLDAFGNIERSSAKAGLMGKSTLGALIVRDVKTGIRFKIGTGFNDAQRTEIWENQEKFLGRIIEYQHQGVGTNRAPRFPSPIKDKEGNLIFRDPRDMDSAEQKEWDRIEDDDGN